MDMNQSIPNLEMAKVYLSWGLKPLPVHHPLSDGRCSCGKLDCSSIGKHPMVFGWDKVETVITERYLEEFWRKKTLANVAICAGGKRNILYLDIDTHFPEKNGFDSLAKLEEKNGKLPETLRQRTGGGGEGRLFIVQDAGKLAKIKNRVAIMPGLDLRVSGGYFVAPPSLHASGNRYEWLNLEQSIAEAPEWFVDFCIEACSKRSNNKVIPRKVSIDKGNRNNQLSKALAIVSSAEQGSRNATLNQQSFIVGLNAHRERIDEDKAVAELTKAGLSTGLDEKEVENTVRRAINAGKEEAGSQDGNFWSFVENKTGNISVKIDTALLYDFLMQCGFSKIYIDDHKSTLVRIQDNIVEEISPERIMDFVLLYIVSLREFPRDEEQKDSLKRNEYAYNCLVSAIKNPHGKYFKEAALKGGLSPCNTPFMRDGKDESFFFFRNCIVRATKDGIYCQQYTELKNLVWKRWVSDRDFYPEKEKGVFEDFVSLAFAQDPLRIKGIRSAIGYLLHRYKKPSETKAIILYDQIDSAFPDGRTGKSLLLKAIGKIRNMADIDGKDFDPGKSFAFQGVDCDSEIVGIDDVLASLNFERLFHRITSGFEIEKKNVGRITIDFEDAPKIIITTNHLISQRGGSAEARKVEYGLHPYFSAKHTPIDEFGHNFFIDWDEIEWSKFFNYMLSCCVDYLREGLSCFPVSGLEDRKLRIYTSPEFVDWAYDYFACSINQGEWLSTDALYSLFLTFSSDFKTKSEKGFFTKNTFNKWLREYCGLKHIGLQETTRRVAGQVKKCFLFEKREDGNTSMVLAVEAPAEKNLTLFTTRLTDNNDQTFINSREYFEMLGIEISEWDTLVYDKHGAIVEIIMGRAAA